MITTGVLNQVLAIVSAIIIAFIIGSIIPGFERKYVHARIQQRIGPSVISPGIMAPIKFLFKENIKPNSTVPGLYKSLPIICFIVILLILIFLMPQTYTITAIASVIAIIGFLKVEEIAYVLMGALSKSIMSLSMPFPDLVKGGLHTDSQRSYIEDISSKRAFRLISFGSFPLYLSLFVPVSIVGSVYLKDIVNYQAIHGPILFTTGGILGFIVFFVGYMILMNEYPFTILKAKADVIEGPYMEYASKYRSIVYFTRGFLIFTMSMIFSVLFIGTPLNIFSWKILINIAIAFIFPLIMGIISAFSPIFTNKQLYPTVIGTSLLGVLAIIVSLL